MLIGGLVSAACMIYLGGKLPNGLLLILMAVIAMIAGALWGLIPALFKAKYRTNETLFTLMMNYIALQLVEFYVDVWDKKQSHSVGVINSSTKAGWLPSLFGQQYGLLVLIVLLLTALMYVYLKRTKQGYEIAVVGESENTARYAGISVSHVIKRTMLISGAIAGLAGFLEVAGVSHTISSATAGGRGFTAIIVAWLAKLNPYAVIVVSILFGALIVAGREIQPSGVSFMIQGTILFLVISSDVLLKYHVRLVRTEEETA